MQMKLELPLEALETITKKRHDWAHVQPLKCWWYHCWLYYFICQLFKL